MASVTISPNPVAPGQGFQVGFSGYAPNSIVVPFFASGSPSEPIPIDISNNGVAVQLNAQGGGTWGSTILPTTPARTYTLYVVNTATGVQTTHSLQVQPLITYTRVTRFVSSQGVQLSNGSIVEVGDVINVILLDYPPNTDVDVLIQSEVIGSGTTAFNGNAGFTVAINRAGTFDLRVNEHGNGTDYGQIMVTVKVDEDPLPDPDPGVIDPLWIIGGVIALGGVALVASGGLKKIL